MARTIFVNHYWAAIERFMRKRQFVLMALLVALVCLAGCAAPAKSEGNSENAQPSESIQLSEEAIQSSDIPAEKEDDVAFAGIAACKVPDWLMQPADDFKETYEGEYLDSVFCGDLQPDEEDGERLVDYIATHQIFVGEDEADDLILMSM